MLNKSFFFYLKRVHINLFEMSEIALNVGRKKVRNVSEWERNVAKTCRNQVKTVNEFRELKFINSF